MEFAYDFSESSVKLTTPSQKAYQNSSSFKVLVICRLLKEMLLLNAEK